MNSLLAASLVRLLVLQLRRSDGEFCSFKIQNKKLVSDGDCETQRDNLAIRELDAKLAARVIRLADGSDNYGRVEILYNGTWGTVCDDLWDTEDATVVCRMLGFQNSAIAYSYARYGQGTLPIWLDDVNCEGNERTIWNCRKRDWGEHNCRHYEDASVSCT